MNYLFVSILVCTYVYVSVSTDITKLEDGVILEQGSDLQVEEGRWTPLLTITTPGNDYREKERDRLIERVDELWAILANQPHSKMFTQGRRWLLRSHLDMIRRDNRFHFNLTKAVPPRIRRGLINAVGSGLSLAFGTATTDQVNAVREELRAAYRKQAAVVHNVDKLVTVVNQTRYEQRETRRQLAVMERAYNTFVANEQSRWNQLESLLQLMNIEQLVSSLVDMDISLDRELIAIQHLHDTLRRGQLTELFCPPELISEIAKNAARHALVPLDYQWYYENVRVVPLLLEDGRMTYQISLPFIKHAVYNRYQIRTYPVPVDHTGLEVRVDATKDIATHTTQGYWFQPAQCMGRNPELCRTGPLYRESYSCERALITGHTPDHVTCMLVRSVLTNTIADEAKPGQYILRTHGETVTLSCEGKRQERTTLQRGTYIVNLEGTCTLEGDAWKLKGELLQFVAAMAQKPRLSIIPLNLNEMIPLKWMSNDSFDVQVPVVQEEAPISNIEWDDMGDGMELYHEITHHISTTNIIIFVFVTVIVICAGIWLYQRRDRLRFFLARKSHQLKIVKFSKKDPEDIVEIEGQEHEDTVESVNEENLD